MNFPRYAVNARNLLQTRQNGFRPSNPVNVALAGQNFRGTTLYVHDDMPTDLDWRMLVNLDVWVWADRTVPLDRVIDTTVAISRAMPAWLLLRFVEAGEVHDIDVGSGQHHDGQPSAGIRPEHSFLWLPLNVCGSALGYRLKRALCNPSTGGKRKCS